jgi:hypothetical protein
MGTGDRVVCVVSVRRPEQQQKHPGLPPLWPEEPPVGITAIVERVEAGGLIMWVILEVVNEGAHRYHRALVADWRIVSFAW